MRGVILGFAAGLAVAAYGWQRPPPWPLLVGAAAASTLLGWRWRDTRIPLAVLWGVCWAAVNAQWTLQAQLAERWEGRDLWARGRVTGLPEAGERRTRFNLELACLSEHRLGAGAQRAAAGGGEAASGCLARGGRIRLSWYSEAPELRPGEIWRLQVRLGVPHGWRNPGTFDYERWLFREGIKATGYVRASDANRRLGERTSINRWRSVLAERVADAAPNAPARALLPALAAGDRRGLEDRHWRVLRQTGTVHLVAISGLHIGLFFLLAYTLLLKAARALPELLERRPAAQWAAGGAWLCACGYAALAGFALPTQRALIMVGAYALALGGYRGMRFSDGFCWALLLVLLWDPWAVLSRGFWLSFAAVAIIGYINVGRLSRGSAVAELVRLQLAISAAMVALQWLFFNEASWLSPGVNLVAVPLTGWVVVPGALVGAALAGAAPALAEPVLGALGWALALGWQGLVWLAERTQPLALSAGVGPLAWGCAVAGVAWLLAPAGVPGRWLAGALWLPLITQTPPRPAEGGLRLTLLDVGQGLSVVARTRRHTLLYDAGARFSARSNAGESVIVPYLRHRGLGHLDKLVLSHGDADHIGGAPAVLAQLSVGGVLGAAPGRGGEGVAQERCRAGQSWRWDGVRFRVLHPSGTKAARWDAANNRSCVLKIQGAGYSILLPGDIQRPVEYALARGLGERLRAQVLVAPHHGSASSSSAALLEAVAPSHVLFARGYGNPFGHPAQRVVRRYRERAVKIYDSAVDGAVQYHFRPGQALPQPWRARVEGRHLWTHRPPPPGGGKPLN